MSKEHIFYNALSIISESNYSLLSALKKHFGSFEKAIEVTSEIFQTAGKVLPATLDNASLKIEYEDGTTKIGEKYLDEILTKVKRISFEEKNIRGYEKAVNEIGEADLIIVGPGSLYGSLICNLLIREIKQAIVANKKAVKLFVMNCSTERTQTRNYSVGDHLDAIRDHVGIELFDYCLVNSNVLRRSRDESKLGEVNNITTNEKIIDGVKIIRADIISRKNPLYHDPEKLAKEIIELYNKYKSQTKDESRRTNN